jgi:hypothetical protein
VTAPGFGASERADCILVRIGPSATSGRAAAWFSDVPYSGDDIGADVRLVGRVTFERRASVRFWQSGRARPSFGSIDLIGLDGALDWLLWEDVRDRPVDVYIGGADEPLQTMTQALSARIEEVRTDGHGILRVVLADATSVLDEPVQGAVYSVDGLEGQPVPMTIGDALSVPLVQGGVPLLLYDVHDDDTASVSGVRDAGVLLTALTDWQPAAAPHQVEMLVQPVGRLVADVSGSEVVIAYLLNPTDGDWTAAWSGAPTGWTAAVGGVATITNSSGALLQALTPNTGNAARLTYSTALTAGVDYIMRIESAQRLGGLQLVEDATGPDRRVVGIIGPGVWLLPVTRESTGVLSIEAIQSPDRTIDHTVTAVTIYERQLTQTGGTSTAVFGEFVQYLTVDRYGWDAARIDLQAVDDIDALGYRYGYHAARPVSATRILDDLADSVCGWWTTDRFGRLTFGRLQDAPAPTLAVDDSDLISDVEVRRDWAPGFSSIVSGGRNWQPLDQSELAGSLQGTTTGALLTQTHRHRRTGADAANLPPGFEAAARRGGFRREGGREPEPGMTTLLQDVGDVQDVADYATGLYVKPRHFVDFTLALPALQAATLEPGAVIELTSERYGLPVGRGLTVVAVRGVLGQSRVEVTAWGWIAPEPPDEEITPDPELIE